MRQTAGKSRSATIVRANPRFSASCPANQISCRSFQGSNEIT
jgi:hypothetical protein